jgi:hypothetical protein
MSAHKIETTIDKDGVLILENLPFRAGDKVEVVITQHKAEGRDSVYSLRGKPLYYEDPTKPIAEQEWDVLK